MRIAKRARLLRSGELHPVLIHLLQRKTGGQRSGDVDFGGIGSSHDDSVRHRIDEIARRKREHGSLDAELAPFAKRLRHLPRGKLQFPDGVISLDHQRCFKGRGKCDGEHGVRDVASSSLNETGANALPRHSINALLDAI